MRAKSWLWMFGVVAAVVGVISATPGAAALPDTSTPSVWNETGWIPIGTVKKSCAVQKPWQIDITAPMDEWGNVDERVSFTKEGPCSPMYTSTRVSIVDSSPGGGTYEINGATGAEQIVPHGVVPPIQTRVPPIPPQLNAQLPFGFRFGRITFTIAATAGGVTDCLVDVWEASPQVPPREVAPYTTSGTSC